MRKVCIIASDWARIGGAAFDFAGGESARLAE